MADLRFGTTDVATVKYGTTQVKKIYQGTNLVWEDYVPSWQVIHSATNLTLNQTLSVPSGANIRVTHYVPLDGETLTTEVTSSAQAAAFEEWDHIDEGTGVFIYGQVNIVRTNTTTLTVSNLTDSGDPSGHWVPSFIQMEAYY